MSVIRAWQATLYGHPDFPVGPFDEHQHDVAVLPWPEWEAQQARNYFLEQELATAQQRIRELESTINMMHGQLKYHRELTRKLSGDLAEETGYAVLENYGECLAKNAELEQEVERLRAPKEELVTTARNAGKHAFIECDTCRAKPGSPTLCWGCLHNRQLISWQQGKIVELEGRLEAALHGVPAQAEIDRLTQEVERLRNRLEVCLRG